MPLAVDAVAITITREDTKMKNKTEFYHVYVTTKGIKKRCRKVDRHGFSLQRVPLSVKDNEESLEKIKEAARYRLALEMKEHGEASVSFTYGYTEDDSPFEMSHPFDEKNFRVAV